MPTQAAPQRLPMATAPVDCIRLHPGTSWQPDLAPEARMRLRRQLEAGCVLFFPDLHFELAPDEWHLLDPHLSDGRSKNINLRGDSHRVRGATAPLCTMAALRILMSRYAACSEQLVNALFPDYVGHV